MPRGHAEVCLPQFIWFVCSEDPDCQGWRQGHGGEGPRSLQPPPTIRSIRCNHKHSHSLRCPGCGYRLALFFPHHHGNKPICIIVPYLSSGPAGSLAAAVELCLTDVSSLCSCRRGPACGHRRSLSAKCPAGPACRVSLHGDWEANPCHRMDRYGQLELHFWSIRFTPWWDTFIVTWPERHLSVFWWHN